MSKRLRPVERSTDVPVLVPEWTSIQREEPQPEDSVIPLTVAVPDLFSMFEPCKSLRLEEHEWRCALCGGIVGEDDTVCRHCGKYPSWATPPEDRRMAK